MKRMSVAPGRRAGEDARVGAADEVKFCQANLDVVDRKGVFEGYASVFNRQDLGRDVVLPGAFRRSLLARGTAGVRMLFQHDPNEPIGVWEKIHEDARGLYVRGRLMVEVRKGREVLSLMRAGAIDGLSIGFRVEQGVRSRRTGLRRLSRIDLWEVSVVTFPMLPEARIAHVKSRPVKVPYVKRQVPGPADLEHWLRQDVGLTHRQARAVTRDRRAGLDPLGDGSAHTAMHQRLVEQIAEAARLMQGGACVFRGRCPR